jgi:hypothetical protein
VNEHALSTRPIDTVSQEAATQPTAPRYWAFVSYSHADSADADRLHKRLETFQTPRLLVGTKHPLGRVPARLTPIFRDRQELAASSDLAREIREALADSRYLVVICSPAAAASKWVDQEVRDFKRLHGEDRVLAAIVAGEPFAADPARECFPPSLKVRIDRRGKPTGRPAEPIAADLRESRDGWKSGTLKIIAGLLDVGLDDLVRRDQQRRQKRMTWIVAASLAGMAFTTGMSVLAIDARDAARDERREAESLVSFMLGDLRDELEPIGELDSLDKVGSRALAYYARQDRKKLTDDQLAQRSKALTLLGQIAVTRGDSSAAAAYNLEALRGTEEIVLRAPDDPQRLFDHAQNVFYRGELARSSGKLDQAEQAYREYQRLAARMVSAEPANPRWQMEKVYAAQNIGIVLLLRRRFSEAAQQFETTLKPMFSVAAANPDKVEYKREYSNVLAWLADARSDEGKLSDAAALRAQQIAFLDRTLTYDPRNVKLQELLIPAKQGLGILLIAQGKTAPGIERLQSAFQAADRLTRIEPDNAIWKSLSASARLELARTLLASRRITLATVENDIGCTLSAELRALDPKDTQWRPLRTRCLANRSRLAQAQGDLPAALTNAAQALGSARSERSEDPVRNRYSIAAAYRRVGDVHGRMGTTNAAIAAWTAGLDQLPRSIAERPREMAERAALLEKLGRNAEARALNDRLRSIGFIRNDLT